MPEHYTHDPRDWRSYAAALSIVAWALVAVPVAWALRHGRAWLTGHAPRWQPLAHAVLVCALGLYAWRALTSAFALLGPSHADAAGVVGPMPDAPPELQRGYEQPGEETPAHEKDPMEPLMPDAPAPPIDDGGLPSWLPPGLESWWPDIVDAAHANGLDSHAWGAIVAQENPWGNPAATSPAGAVGLAQLMPLTAADIAGQTGIDVTTPTGNLRGGAFYFAERVRDNGDLWTEGNDLPTLLAAAAAYNGGGPPSQDVRAAAMAGASDLCAGVRYSETRRYCYAYADRWVQTLAERATYIQPVAPGGPDHLEVSSEQP